MRLDIYIFEKDLSYSRTEAKSLIAAGSVLVNGKTVTKPSFSVDDCDEVSVTDCVRKYASRGGFKLEAALSTFNISVVGKLALDIGASSGGFTDCLLQNGAEHIIAVDSGSGQLVTALRRNSRVTVIENFNARYMKPSDFEYKPTLVVMDVSFISATCIIPAIYDVCESGADFICLIKPQFEVGRGGIGKGGIVKDDKLRKGAVEKVIKFAESVGFKFNDVCPSPIKGGDGNIEFLAYFTA